MEGKPYGVLRGKVVNAAAPDPLERHYHLQVDAPTAEGTVSHRVAVNVKAMQIGLQAVMQRLRPVEDGRFVEWLRALPMGVTRLEGEDQLVEGRPPGLDFIRVFGLKRDDLEPLPLANTDGGNKLTALMDEYVSYAREDPEACVYAFGRLFGQDVAPEDPPKSDQVFGFRPVRGIHDIHMNQGGFVPFESGNAIYEDGALYFDLPGAGKVIELLLAFQVQAFNTDKNGNPSPDARPL